MYISNKPLVLLLVVLCGCQPETSAQSPVAPPLTEQAEQPAASGTAAITEADAMQLAKENNCFACHALDHKIIGPSFKEVAAKYRSDSGAEAMLMAKIAQGGSGVWGVMAMPPSPKISEADRRILANFVLSSK